MDKGITACLVVYNEEAIMRTCLESIKDVVNEIIVVHDGECKDASLTIAREYGAKVFIRKHAGVCEAHRIFTFEKAQCPWILMIDADEALSFNLQNQIRNLVADIRYNAYAFDWPMIKNGRYIPGTYGNRYKTVLFQKEKAFYIAITHEGIGTYGTLCTRDDLLLEHNPQTKRPTLLSLHKKLQKIALIQAREIMNLEKAPIYNISEKKENSHYHYYLQYRNHPLFMCVKQVAFDVWRSVTVEKLITLGRADPKVFAAVLLRNMSWFTVGSQLFLLRFFIKKGDRK